MHVYIKKTTGLKCVCVYILYMGFFLFLIKHTEFMYKAL